MLCISGPECQGLLPAKQVSGGIQRARDWLRDALLVGREAGSSRRHDRSVRSADLQLSGE